MTENIVEYTNRMAREGAAKGMFRQCSLGWHDECSDPAGEECTCPHHKADLCMHPDCASDGCKHCGATDAEWCKPGCDSPVKTVRDKVVYQVEGVLTYHRVTYQMSLEGDYMCNCGDVIKLAEFPTHIAEAVVSYVEGVVGEDF